MSQIRRPPTQILTGDSMPMSLAIVKVARHKTTCDSASVYTSVVWRIHASRWCVLFLSGRFMKILKSEFLKMYQKIKSFRLTHLIRDVDLRCNMVHTKLSDVCKRFFDWSIFQRARDWHHGGADYRCVQTNKESKTSQGS